jgi:hypothetical protein
MIMRVSAKETAYQQQIAEIKKELNQRRSMICPVCDLPLSWAGREIHFRFWEEQKELYQKHQIRTLRDAYRSALEVIRRQAEAIKGLRALVDMQEKNEIHKMAAILNPYSVTCAHVTESYFKTEPRKPEQIGQEWA